MTASPIRDQPSDKEEAMTKLQNKRVDVEYRRHRIIASAIKGRPEAAVWQGGHRLFGLSADTIDQAVVLAKAEIDRRVLDAKSGRRLPYVGTTEEYVAAF